MRARSTPSGTRLLLKNAAIPAEYRSAGILAFRSRRHERGPVAQLGERVNRTHEARGSSPFIPAIEICQTEPETLAGILDFDPCVRARRRVEACPVHSARAKQGLFIRKVAVDGAALDTGLLGDCRHCGPCWADGSVELHRRLGDP